MYTDALRSHVTYAADLLGKVRRSFQTRYVDQIAAFSTTHVSFDYDLVFRGLYEKACAAMLEPGRKTGVASSSSKGFGQNLSRKQVSRNGRSRIVPPNRRRLPSQDVNGTARSALEMLRLSTTAPRVRKLRAIMDHRANSLPKRLCFKPSTLRVRPAWMTTKVRTLTVLRRERVSLVFSRDWVVAARFKKETLTSLGPR